MKTSLKENIEALKQGEEVLRCISDAAYAQPEKIVFQSTVGMHIRHNLDHYACFLNGLESGCIDYAARQRDSRTEQDRSYALAKMSKIRESLENLMGSGDIGSLFVERDVGRGQDISSANRELAFLLSHTIHHYAIVAVICQLQGFPVVEGFGVAPSTLRHRAAQVAECAH